MDRRIKLSRGEGPSGVMDLWALRIFWQSGLWADIKGNDTYDHDALMAYGCFRELRDECAFAMGIACNKAFLETGDLSEGRFETEEEHYARQKSEDPDNEESLPACLKDYDKTAAVPQEKRLEVIHRVTAHAVESDSSLPCVRSDAAETLGGYWKRALGKGFVARWLGRTQPESLERAIAALEAEYPDEGEGYPGPMAQNMAEMREAFGLSKLEGEVLAFILATTGESLLRQAVYCFDFTKLGTDLIIDVMALGLAVPRREIEASLSPDAALMRSGLIAFGTDNDRDFDDRFQLADRNLQSILSTRIGIEKLFSSWLGRAAAGELALRDYVHIPAVERILLPYLRQAIASGRRGANVLLYGLPGTGKTQLARTLAGMLGLNLYEVAYKSDGQTSRLRRWKAASSFLSSVPKAVLAIDEAEDVFNDAGSAQPSFMPGHFAKGIERTNKGEINSLLESNPVPTFWVTNAIDRIDPAMVRRFDIVLEVPLPDADGRRRIVNAAFGGKLSEETVERLVNTPNLAPAVLKRASAVTELAGKDAGDGGPKLGEDDVIEMISETLRAQRFGSVASRASVLPAVYDPGFVNSDLDLNALADGLKSAGMGRLCLYGPPGTGKSAYAAWLAQKLGRPLVKKTAAELSSCWVGETEKLIAAAFREAARSKAVLLIDEADSFLLDRTGAQHSWETTQVNEMLTQLESYMGYFIATTNLIDALDRASLRRFDLKAKFDFLRPEQAALLAEKHLELAGLMLDAATRSRIMDWRSVTPGDFAAVSRQSAFRPIRSAEDFADRLAEELEVKGAAPARIGFC